jgi:hypothetical protein
MDKAVNKADKIGLRMTTVGNISDNLGTQNDQEDYQ